jgi:hypothetical protein
MNEATSRSTPTRIARCAALVAAGMGCAGFAGSVSGISALQSVLPGAAPMQANAAVCLLAAGMALFVLTGDAAARSLRRRAGVALALFVAAIGLSFVGYLWNANEIIAGTWLPSVAASTALGLVLLGVGLVFAAQSSNGARGRDRRMTFVEKRVLAGFVGAFLLLLFGGGLAARAGSEISRAWAPVTQSQEVRAALAVPYGAVMEAEAEAARIRELTLISLLVTLTIAAGVFLGLFRSIRRDIAARHDAEQLDSARHRALSLFASTFSRERTLRGFLDLLAEPRDYLAAACYTHDEVTGLVSREAFRSAAEDASGLVQLMEGPVAETRRTRGTVVTTLTGHVAHTLEGYATEVVAVIACPVSSHARMLGALAIVTLEPVTGPERLFVERMAANLGVALDNLQQRCDLKRLTEELGSRNEQLSRKNAALEEVNRHTSALLARVRQKHEAEPELPSLRAEARK